MTWPFTVTHAEMVNPTCCLTCFSAGVEMAGRTPHSAVFTCTQSHSFKVEGLLYLNMSRWCNAQISAGILLFVETHSLVKNNQMTQPITFRKRMCKEKVFTQFGELQDVDKLSLLWWRLPTISACFVKWTFSYCYLYILGSITFDDVRDIGKNLCSSQLLWQ